MILRILCQWFTVLWWSMPAPPCYVPWSLTRPFLWSSSWNPNKRCELRDTKETNCYSSPCAFSISAFACPYVFCCSNVALAGDAMVPWTYGRSMSCGREGCDRGKSSSLLIRLGPGISCRFHILNYKPVLLLGGKCKGCCNQMLQMWQIYKYIYIYSELHIRTVIGIAMTTRHPACQRLRTDSRLGFHRERAGGLCYWKRSRQNVAGNLDLAAPRWTQHSDVWGKGFCSLWRWLRWRAVFFEDGCAEWARNIFLVTHFFCLVHTFWSLQKKNQGLPLKYTTTDFLTIIQPHFMWQAGAVGLYPWLRSWLGHLDAVINLEKLPGVKPPSHWHLNRSNRENYNI